MVVAVCRRLAEIDKERLVLMGLKKNAHFELRLARAEKSLVTVAMPYSVAGISAASPFIDCTNIHNHRKTK